MAQIKKAEIKRVYFPSTINELDENDRCWADIKTSIIVNDYFAVEASDQSDNNKTLDTLVNIISSWNLTDDKNTPLPITKETLKTFNFVDFGCLNRELLATIDSAKEALTDQEKKVSSSTSMPSTPVVNQA